MTGLYWLQEALPDFIWLPGRDNALDYVNVQIRMIRTVRRGIAETGSRGQYFRSCAECIPGMGLLGRNIAVIGSGYKAVQTDSPVLRFSP
ncbi:MAG: hypothetical protein ACLTBV_26770 [Enterocloster bolteae]